MSRSRRKLPIFGHTTCKSEKQDKREANRSLRRNNKMRVAVGKDPITKRENRNIWSFGKDGKVYSGPECFKDDPEYFRKIMTK